MRNALGVFIAATFAAALAVVVDEARQREPLVVIEERTEIVPPPGQAELSGTVTSLDAEGATAPPLPMPLAVDPAPGEVRATIDGAIVDGERTTIVWNGGRPLRIQGDGGIDLGATRVEIRADGAVWPLEGEPRTFTPGSYTVDATVAVGRAGLAAPRDGVVFEADDGTTLTASGGIAARTPPTALHLEGPGRLHLEGTLSVRTADGTTSVSVLDFGPGPYVVDLVPTTGGWRLDATIRGPRTTH